MAGISSYAQPLVINAILTCDASALPGTLYACLLKVVPDDGDTGATIIEPDPTTEYVGYTRIAVTMDSANWASQKNVNAIAWPTTGAGSNVVIAAACLCDSATIGAGHLWYWAGIPGSGIGLTVSSAGVEATIPPGAFVLGAI